MFTRTVAGYISLLFCQFYLCSSHFSSPWLHQPDFILCFPIFWYLNICMCNLTGFHSTIWAVLTRLKVLRWDERIIKMWYVHTHTQWNTTQPQKGMKLCHSHVAPVVKNLPASAGDVTDAGSIPGSGRSPAGGQGNWLQYSCLENPMDRGAWGAPVHRVRKSQTRLKGLSTHTYSKMERPRDLPY